MPELDLDENRAIRLYKNNEQLCFVHYSCPARFELKEEIKKLIQDTKTEEK